MNLCFDPLVALAAGAILLFTTHVCAQNPQRADRPPLDPAIDALLTKVAKMRGLDAKAKAPTLTQSGTYTVQAEGMAKPVAKGTFRESFTPTDARQIMQMGPMGSMERGNQGELVWESDPAMGAKVRRGAQAAQCKRYFAVLRGADVRQLYREFQPAGTQEIGGREVTVLKMIPAEGKPDLWYVDANGEVLRIDMQLPAPESADAAFGMDDMMAAQVGFTEWTQVDGGRLPRQRTLRMGPMTVTLTCDTMTVGATIEPKEFVPPKAVLLLKPEAPQPAFDAEGKPTYQVVERQLQYVASIRLKCKPSEISAKLAEMLPEVMAHLNATGVAMAGAPFSRYHAWSDAEIDLEAGIPVQQPFEAKGRVVNSALPAGRAVTCWHVGPYDQLTAAHQGLRTFVETNKHKSNGGHWEVYWTDPGMVPDPAKWKTQLFAPIQ